MNQRPSLTERALDIGLAIAIGLVLATLIVNSLSK